MGKPHNSVTLGGYALAMGRQPRTSLRHKREREGSNCYGLTAYSMMNHDRWSFWLRPSCGAGSLSDEGRAVPLGARRLLPSGI